jgi:hypothetical protein
MSKTCKAASQPGCADSVLETPRPLALKRCRALQQAVGSFNTVSLHVTRYRLKCTALQTNCNIVEIERSQCMASVHNSRLTPMDGARDDCVAARR